MAFLFYPGVCSSNDGLNAFDKMRNVKGRERKEQNKLFLWPPYCVWKTFF